jgi:hypothetical protein
MPDNGKIKGGSGGFTPPDFSKMKPEYLELTPEKEFQELKTEYEKSVKEFQTSVADEIDYVAAGSKIQEVLFNADRKVNTAYDNATAVIDRVFNSVAALNARISDSLNNAYSDIGGATTMTETDLPKTKAPQTKIELLMKYINKLDLTKIDDKNTAHQVQQIMFLAAQLVKDYEAQTSYEKMMDRISNQRTQQQKEIMDQYWQLLEFQDRRTEILKERADLYKKRGIE